MAAKKQLYRNLNNGKFSLRFKGRVVAHPEAVIMDSPVMVVSSPGQLRVRKNKVKNVHAYIGSENVQIIEADRAVITGLREVYYCPYTCDGFEIKDTGERVESAPFLVGVRNKIYIP